MAVNGPTNGVGPWRRTGSPIFFDLHAGLPKGGRWRSIEPTAPILIWIEKCQTGGLDEDAAAADLLQSFEARIAALERLVGKQALELEFLKGTSRAAPRPKSHHVRHHRPSGVSIAQRCRLMAIARSTLRRAFAGR